MVGSFVLCHRVHTGSEAHPTSYLVNTESFYPEGKVALVWR